MAPYGGEFGGRRGRRAAGARRGWMRWARGGAPTRPGGAWYPPPPERAGYGREYYGEEYVFGRRVPRPHKPARGFPVRGYHTYDMDYGRQAGGPTTDYSGRAGYPTQGAAWETEPRGPYTPWVEETERWERRRPPRRRPPRHWSTEEPPGRWR